MSLANLVNRSIVVEVNPGDATSSVELFGLSPNDIAGIIVSQRGVLEQVFDIAENQGVKGINDIARLDLAKLGMRLLAEVPDFLAHVIAYAAREPEQAHKVLFINAPTQLKMLKAVCELSFNDVAGFQEFVGNVAAVLASARGVVPQLNQVARGLNDSRIGGSASAQPSLS